MSYMRLSDVIKWLGISPLEMIFHIIGIFLTSLLYVLKIELSNSISWWQVFAPLFAANAFHSYFTVIVFIRMILEENASAKATSMRAIFMCFIISMVFLFQFLLCSHLDRSSSRSSFGVIFIPVYIILASALIRACQMESAGH